MKQIALVTNNPALCKIVSVIIENIKDYECQFTAENGFELIKRLNSEKRIPYIIIVDMGVPLMDGLATISFLNHHYNTLKITAIYNANDSNLVSQILHVGPYPCIPKENLNTTLVKGILTQLETSDFSIDQSFTNSNNNNNGNDCMFFKKGYLGLSEKELIFLELTTTGLSYWQIAEVLNVAGDTIYNYQKNIKEKTGLSSRHEFILFAIRNGIARITGIKRVI